MDRGGLTACLVLLCGDSSGQRTQRKEGRMPTQQMKGTSLRPMGKVDLNPIIVTHFTTPGRAVQADDSSCPQEGQRGKESAKFNREKLGNVSLCCIVS